MTSYRIRITYGDQSMGHHYILVDLLRQERYLTQDVLREILTGTYREELFGDHMPPNITFEILSQDYIGTSRLTVVKREKP